jgi:hypothetical protein
MKLHDFPESDWKVFRELREVALDRFCRRVLEEIEPLCLAIMSATWTCSGVCESGTRSLRALSTIRGVRR